MKRKAEQSAIFQALSAGTEIEEQSFRRRVRIVYEPMNRPLPARDVKPVRARFSQEKCWIVEEQIRKRIQHRVIAAANPRSRWRHLIVEKCAGGSARGQT